MTVCHLGNLAYWHHRELHWDPKDWQFVGDAEANTWLDRDRRDPWQLPEISECIRGNHNRGGSPRTLNIDYLLLIVTPGQSSVRNGVAGSPSAL